jgi:dephospho-CoA kinase
MGRPIAVAITGGVGAGKSTALRAFRRHGAATVSSDEIVHHLLATEDAVRDALVERLGSQILGPDGRPDRAAIARIVFRDRDALAFLEQLLHPLVSREYLEWRDQLSLDVHHAVLDDLRVVRQLDVLGLVGDGGRGARECLFG